MEPDEFLEVVIKEFNLDCRSRNLHYCDMRHFFFVWWDENQKLFKKYRGDSKICILMKKKRTSSWHYLNTRSQSYNYDENVKDIKSFIERYDSDRYSVRDSILIKEFKLLSDNFNEEIYYNGELFDANKLTFKP